MAARQDSLDNALNFARKAIELEPGVLGHQLVLAHVLFGMNRVDLAIRHAERVEAAAESNGDRMAARRFLSMARRYRDAGSGSSESETDRAAPYTNGGQVEDGLKELEGIAGSERQKEMDREFEDNGRRNILKDVEGVYGERDSMEREYLKAVRSAGSGEAVSLEGTLSRVFCFDPAGMVITLDSGGKSHRLHVADYYRIRFTAGDYQPRGLLQPCNELHGTRVVIDYIATPGAAYGGEVQAIEIYKSKERRDTPEIRAK